MLGGRGTRLLVLRDALVIDRDDIWVMNEVLGGVLMSMMDDIYTWIGLLAWDGLDWTAHLMAEECG